MIQRIRYFIYRINLNVKQMKDDYQYEIYLPIQVCEPTLSQNNCMI